MTNFYDMEAKKLTGEVVGMDDYKGKVVLIENTASLWGTTVRDFTQMNELCEKVLFNIVLSARLWKKIQKKVRRVTVGITDLINTILASTIRVILMV